MLKVVDVGLMRRWLSSGLSFLWVTLLILLLDRYSKGWVNQHLSPLEPFEILPIFNLTLAYNKGAAFSFLSSASGWQHYLLGTFAVVVTGVMLVWLSRTRVREYWLNVALCLILGGALGNLWDRILYGYVTDFLDFHWGDWHFAIFNVADSAICVGAAMLLIDWMRKK